MLTKLQERLTRSHAADAGATMLEYGLVMTGIAVVVGAAAADLGGRLAPLFDAVVF